MTILVFWQVGNFEEDYPERYDLDECSHADAFRKLWRNRRRYDAHFYNMESFSSDVAYGLGTKEIGTADDFERDYNDECYDGEHWVKALLIPSDDVIEIIKQEGK